MLKGKKQQPRIIYTARGCLHSFACMQSLQLRLNICDYMDSSPPAGSSVLGILQARILEWVTISYSRGTSWPRDRPHIVHVYCIAGDFLLLSHEGSPFTPETNIICESPMLQKSHNHLNRCRKSILQNPTPFHDKNFEQIKNRRNIPQHNKDRVWQSQN